MKIGFMSSTVPIKSKCYTIYKMRLAFNIIERKYFFFNITLFNVS